MKDMTEFSILVADHGGLVVECQPAVRKDPGSNLTAGSAYHDSHCDIQPWARAVVPRSTQPSTFHGMVK